VTAIDPRTPRDELAETTPHGIVYLRRLVRAQLSLSVVALVAFGGIVGALPLAFAAAPSLMDVQILGIPLPLVLLGPPVFAFFIVTGWLYQRRADSLDDEFRDLVRDE
jgi:hypothetical protein